MNDDDDLELDRTSDTSDIATRQEELARRSALASSRKPEGPAYTGFCLNCDEPLPPSTVRRWCDADCARDWERRQAPPLKNPFRLAPSG